MDKKEIPEDIKTLLKSLVNHFDKEDRAVRERQIRTWRKLKLYWNGFQQVWFSEVAHDWRIWTNEQQEGADDSYYDKPVNVFRAYLESIIAALSVSVPAIKCTPDDADIPLDVATAKAGDKIAELVYKHNDVVLLWLHALYVFFTEGMVACWNYPSTNEKYGTYESKEYEDKEEEKYICPECGAQFDEMNVQQPEPNPEMEMMNQDEFQPEGHCPECDSIIDMMMEKQKITITRLVGVTKQPKTRQMLDVYGGLYVKVPNYARKQEDCPYLIYAYETHYSNAIEEYGDDLDEKSLKIDSSAGGMYDPYERWGRLSPQYQGEYPLNNVTVRNCWFRPSAYNIFNKEDRKKLRDKYPKGVRVDLVNDCIAEAHQSVLDDCWTLTYNPLSDYIHHDPLGLLLTSVQDITNEIVSLVLQTIEHGIPQTFANPAVLNFNAYRQQEVRPGDIFPAKPRSGKGLGDDFYEIKTATLSAEILPFEQKVQEFGQLVSGALPSLFGGQTSGSRTASEYSMSRAQALQRLQTPWKMLTIWWKNIFGKVIPQYIKTVQEDEKFVKRVNNGYINVIIRKADLEGKLGEIELEASEQLPIMWGQVKDTIMQLLKDQNPMILQALTSPENLPLLRSAIGLNQFVIPGESDRETQYEEIYQLLESEPMPNEPDPNLVLAAQQGNPNAQMMLQQHQPELPSVEVNPLIDNHEIHAEIIRTWATSDAGRLAKLEKPEGYKNVLLHMQAHQMIIQQQQMAMQPPVNPPAQKRATNGSGQPIQQ